MKKQYTQDPPFAIQVEPTEGCPLQCSFCGLQGIREKPGNYKFMTVPLAARIADEIARVKWNSRIEFAMHGEPTVNQSLTEIIKVFRQALPRNQLMITSNGAGLVKDTIAKVRALFMNGLNVLALDDYNGVNFVPRIRGELKHTKQLPLNINIHDYPGDGLEYSPHHRWPVGSMQVIYIQDIEQAAKGGHATLNNHCGAGAPLNNLGEGKRCAKPFRELSFRHDGTIAICCNDWRGRYRIGDITREPIDKLWNNAAFTAARRKLYHGQRDFGACAGCDALSYRVGLLPDHKGHVTLPKPDDADRLAIKQATKHGTLVQIVLRPWEVQP